MRDADQFSTPTEALPAIETDLKRLESQVDELLVLVHRLREENRSLRTRQDSLAAERASLMSRNEQARTRVEAIMGRLRTMESGA